MLVFSLLVGGLVADLHLERTDLNLALKDQREVAVREVSLLASKIEAETNSTFYLIVGLIQYIEINGGISAEMFDALCAQLLSTRPGLQNIAAAPDMVIRYIYPLEGNEAAVGLDYAKTPRQKAAAYQVKSSGEPVIAGPLNLVQGGEAFVGRFPVYTVNLNSGESEFWGILSTPFYTDALYTAVGLEEISKTLNVAIRGRDGTGSNGEVFYGDEAIYFERPVIFPIGLLSGSWELAAIPVGGWITRGPNVWSIRAVVIIIVLLLVTVVCLAYLYLLRAQRMRDSLVEVARMKNRFYANMSHELRTPLNSICGLSELIGMTSQDKETCEYAQIILNSADTLTHLLDDMLALSEMDKADSCSKAEMIEVKSLLDDIIPPLSHQADSKQIGFSVDPISENCARIITNASMLRQILWNLLSNAVKFTDSGAVKLSVEFLEPQQICFVVKDTGIGISEEFIDLIFDDFVQEDDSDTRRFGGAGLGLAITRRFVRQLGGSIQVESVKGQGSVFRVTLPQQG